MGDDAVKQITEMVSEFSDEFLDDELKALNIKLINKLACRDDVSLNRGKAENWACGIIYAIGQLNFLFEYSFNPYVNKNYLYGYFNANEQTIWNKARDIRRLLKLKLGDEEFSTELILSLNIEDSDEDFKRIRTFEEIRFKRRQSFPRDVNDVNNDVLVNLINEMDQSNADEYLDEMISILHSAYLIRSPFTLKLNPDNDDTFKIPLFTDMDKYKLDVPNFEFYLPSPFPFCNVIDYMGNKNFKGLLINPEYENYTISDKLIEKVYPDYEENYYRNIYF